MWGGEEETDGKSTRESSKIGNVKVKKEGERMRCEGVKKKQNRNAVEKVVKYEI